MIRDVLKKATKGAITWVGTQFGIPAPITKGATDIAESLFTKQSGGGEFRIIDTSVQAPNLSKFSMRASMPGGAGSARGYAETVNPETLYAAWDRRLGKYYSDKYKVARTVKGKVV